MYYSTHLERERETVQPPKPVKRQLLITTAVSRGCCNTLARVESRGGQHIRTDGVSLNDQVGGDRKSTLCIQSYECMSIRVEPQKVRRKYSDNNKLGPTPPPETDNSFSLAPLLSLFQKSLHCVF